MGVTQRITSIVVHDFRLSFVLFLLHCNLIHNSFVFRYQGIWDHIKNDKLLFEDSQCVRDIMQLSLLLSEKLQKKSERCRQFLEDLSSSLFFTAALPQLIQNNASELSRYVIFRLFVLTNRGYLHESGWLGIFMY